MQFTGRLAMRVAATERSIAQSVSAGFDLKGRPEAGQLELAGPLGTLLAQAQWRPGEVILVTQQGKQRFDSLDTMSREALGETLPLAALFDWLSGKPWPGAASSRGTAANGFTQLGWDVDLSQFESGQVRAERASAPAVALRVQLEKAAPAKPAARAAN